MTCSTRRQRVRPLLGSSVALLAGVVALCVYDGRDPKQWLHYRRRSYRRSLAQGRFSTAKYMSGARRDEEANKQAIARDPSTSQPSYCHICEEILHQMAQRRPQVVHIREQESVCLEERNVASALTTLFMSTWLAEQAKLEGIQIEYQHLCNQTPRKPEQSLIQQNLPSPLMDDATKTTIGTENLRDVCNSLLYLSSGFDILSLLSHFSPIFRSNLEAAERNVRMERDGILSPQVDATTTTTMIHFPCANESCTDIVIQPFYAYLAMIPPSTRFIDIVVDPQACQIAACQDYKDRLVASIQAMYPRSEVKTILAASGSMQTFTRMMIADAILCSHGYGSACLIPAVARGYHGKFVFYDDQHFAQLQMTKSWRAAIVPSFQSPVGSLSMAPLGFEMQQLDQSICLALRGRVGQWVQDMELAPNLQYQTALMHHSGAAERNFHEKVDTGQSTSLRYRPATTYVWQESQFPSCALDLVNRNKMCSLLRRTDVRRFFFLGDSLTLQMALSLWMLMGPEVDVPIQDNGEVIKTVKCSEDGRQPFEFIIQFVRNDELLETAHSIEALQSGVQNCHNYCFPWKQSYMVNRARTIMIVNTGAHLHSKELFEAALPRFIKEFDGMKRHGDIVLFRTLVPGHKNCGRHGLKPFTDFQEYIGDVEGQEVKDTYNWGVFSSYNDYMSRLVEKRFSIAEPKTRMELLDVFPMTVLRPDGHMADEFKAPETRKSDCLHYSMPGPVDWWNHLLFTNLAQQTTIATGTPMR